MRSPTFYATAAAVAGSLSGFIAGVSLQTHPLNQDMRWFGWLMALGLALLAAVCVWLVRIHG